MSTETLRLDVGRTDDDGNAKVYFLLGDVAEADAWLPLDVVVALQSALARLAEVEAERDAKIRAAVAEVDRQWCHNIDMCTDGDVSPAVEATIIQLRAERDAAKIELEAWRPVVEAAIAYRDARYTAQAGAAGDHLVAAVDALPTRNVDSTPPGDTDG